MDIEYLLFLQNFRISINDSLTPFVEALSFFAVHYIVLLPVFIYWCLDKKKGMFILFAFRIGTLINAAVKLTACVYRPWVKDPRIIPAGDAIATAGGYSFPSGHTMMSTPIYGGLAIYTRKIKWLSALFVLAIFATMFSRNYLGVHTPQDVLVGFVLGMLSIYISHSMFKYFKRYPEKENKILFFCVLIGLAVFAYINLKPYPMDYVDGKLLVDPDQMTIDAWGDVGGFIALTIAYYIEKNFIKFQPTGFNFKGVLFNVIGLIILGLMIYGLKPIIVSYTNVHSGRLLYETVMTFFFVIVWPIVLKIFCSN